MAGGTVVTANLSKELSARLDTVAARQQRSKSWIIRSALLEWLVEDQRRHRLTLEALASVDEGRTIDHEEVVAWVAERKQAREPRHID